MNVTLPVPQASFGTAELDSQGNPTGRIIMSREWYRYFGLLTLSVGGSTTLAGDINIDLAAPMSQFAADPSNAVLDPTSQVARLQASIDEIERRLADTELRGTNRTEPERQNIADEFRPYQEMGELLKTPMAWTPEINFGGAHVGIAYGTNEGWYHIKGKRAFVDCLSAFTSKGSSVGAATISLPVPVSSSGTSIRYCGSVLLQNTAVAFAPQQIIVSGAPSGTSVSIFYTTQAGGVISSLADTDLTNTSAFRMSINYPIA